MKMGWYFAYQATHTSWLCHKKQCQTLPFNSSLSWCMKQHYQKERTTNVVQHHQSREIKVICVRMIEVMGMSCSVLIGRGGGCGAFIIDIHLMLEGSKEDPKPFPPLRDSMVQKRRAWDSTWRNPIWLLYKISKCLYTSDIYMYPHYPTNSTIH